MARQRRRRRADPGANALRGIIQAQVNDALRQEFQAAGLGGRSRRARPKRRGKKAPAAKRRAPSRSVPPASAPPAPPAPPAPSPPLPPPPSPPPPDPAADPDKADDDPTKKDDPDKKDDPAKKDDKDDKSKSKHHYKLIIGVLVLAIGGLFVFMYLSKDSPAPVIVNGGDTSNGKADNESGAKLNGGKNAMTGSAPTWLQGLAVAFGLFGSLAAAYRYRSKKWHSSTELDKKRRLVEEEKQKATDAYAKLKEKLDKAEGEAKQTVEEAVKGFSEAAAKAGVDFRL